MKTNKKSCVEKREKDFLFHILYIIKLKAIHGLITLECAEGFSMSKSNVEMHIGRLIALSDISDCSARA